MGVITHNGEVLQGLPGVASQINFNKTGTNLNSTQVENAIKEVNTKVNTNTSDITGLRNSLASRAKVFHLNVPASKADISGFLGHILGTIIDEQEIGSYVVEGAWDNHDYYTGIVYKFASDTAIGMIEYGVYGAGVQNMQLYSACYKSGVYINYRTAQLERDLVTIPVGSTVVETNRNGEYELMSAIQINSNVSVCGNIKAYFSSGKWYIQSDASVTTNDASICCVFRHV